MNAEAAALQRISAAKLWLTASSGGDVPYLSMALYTMPTVVSTGVETISADENWRVYVNPDWVADVDVPELGAHLGHLVWHLLRDHAGRARSMNVGRRESQAWAIAGDLTVSQTLSAAGHPLAGLAHPKERGLPADLSVEEYFTMLDRLDLAKQPGEGEEHEELGGCGSAADGLARPYQVPDEVATGLDDVHAQELRQQIAIAFNEHMKSRGDTPGEWARWVEQILEPKISWQQVLAASVRRAIAWTHGNTHNTYRRLSRRQAASPRAILPGTQRPVPCVAIVVDTSGSMDDGLLAQALGEVDGVLQSLGSAVGGVQVYSCDAAVGSAKKVSRARELHLVGGGGTDLRVGIDEALLARPRPEILIVLTDGDTPWPVVAPMGCSVVAVLLSRTVVSFCPAWAVRVDCLIA